MFGRAALHLAMLILPGAVGACNAAAPPVIAARDQAVERCPAPDWGARADRIRLPSERVWNRVSVDRGGAIYWNGSPIDAKILEQFVELVTTLNPLPETDLEVDPDAPCDTVARVVELMATGLDCTRLCNYSAKPWRAERN